MVTVKRSRELEEFAREGQRRFEAGDEAWFGETTAHGEVRSFGTAADEQSRGRDAVLALTIDQVREMNDAAGLDIGRTEEPRTTWRPTRPATPAGSSHTSASGPKPVAATRRRR